ncbi:MAG: PAS domain-containing sensor histidine kinase [Gemmatimonadota bacterium]|nr:PAS domain-containing sensor histidine kinase [Gemmatimonadota bacterium]
MVNLVRSVSRAWIFWLAVFAGVTALMYPWRDALNEAYVALAYLLIVQLASASRGRTLGLTLAGLAFLCFDVFFLEPYGTLAVEKPLDWLILAAFLVTGMVAAQLFERARLAEHADALREAAKLKDAVIASLSHDLRTPLTSIKALAHDLAAGGDEQAMIIEEEADRLSSFVADLLDLSRVNSGVLPLEPEPNEAEDLIGAALQRVSGAAIGRDLRVSLGPGEPLRFGRFDFSQTLRALVNLIENAIKYSDAAQPIDIGVKREGEWLVFSVADRGRGIPATERERIFEPFYRPKGTSPDVGGAGLGLSIARAVMKAQGGSIQYENRDGDGSVFHLRVPAVNVEDLAGTE